MTQSVVHNTKHLDAVRRIIASLAKQLDCNVNVKLWDGSLAPLGANVTGPLQIAISGPGVVGALLRRPTLDNVIRHYIDKRIDFSGGNLIDLGRELSPPNQSKKKIKGLSKLQLARELLPFLRVPTEAAPDAHGFDGEITGQDRQQADNKDYIQFHYDLSNAFYGLFLDPEMVYSCAYFTDWSNNLATAQHDKLDMICRKLRLKPGEHMLDVGSGWGGLLCHAVKNYGVTARGITLSQEQLDYAKAKAERLGIADKVTFELTDYANVGGNYDKIASIGMYEHIGLKNRAGYMGKLRSILNDDGLFLNHAITSRAPKTGILKRRLRPEKRAIIKYIFPGGELDDIGNTVFALERAGFEVHDVEAWRMHYARTCETWCEALTNNREAAIREVGEAKYRIYVAYLGGVALSFERGSLRLFQTLVSKTARRAPPLPPTRSDLYD